MYSFVHDYAELLKPQQPPCLSLYQPTHRSFPDNQQDSIRFKNLLNTLEESLAREHPPRERESLLAPLRPLVDDRDFWQHTLEGLAVLRSPELFRVVHLQRSVPELAIVANTFHIKPIIRIMQSLDRYQVLALDRHSIKLFEGDRDVLDEIELGPNVPRTIEDALGDQLTEPFLTGSAHRGSAGGQAIFHGHGSKKDEVDSDTERFFRAVGRAIEEHHSNPSGLPLVLAALPEYHTLFRRVSQNNAIIEDGIPVHPDSLSIDELRERAWQAYEHHYRARIDRAIERFQAARPAGLSADDLSDVVFAASSGRVETLLLDADRHIPGYIDENGRLAHAELQRPDVGDVLDEVGEQVLKAGGRTLVLPSDRMPTDSGAAAIYRY